jgi:hypothetical protein
MQPKFRRIGNTGVQEPLEFSAHLEAEIRARACRAPPILLAAANRQRIMQPHTQAVFRIRISVGTHFFQEFNSAAGSGAAEMAA